MSVPKRLPVTRGIKTFIETELHIPVGVIRAPIRSGNDDEDYPYLVIQPLGKGRFFGPAFTAPWADSAFSYQIKSVGLTDDQAQVVSDAVRELILDMDVHGNYVHSIEIEDHKVIDRAPAYDSPGEPKDRGKIVEIDDSYVITVTTS